MIIFVKSSINILSYIYWIDDEKKAIKRGIKILSAGLLLGGSAYALYQADKFDVSDFPQKEVVVCGNKVSMEDFYSRLSYTRKGWVYKNEDGKNSVVYLDK